MTTDNPTPQPAGECICPKQSHTVGIWTARYRLPECTAHGPDAQPAGEGGAPERVRVVIRAATSDDWIGVAYQKDYKGDPSAIHEYVRPTPTDIAERARRAMNLIRDKLWPRCMFTDAEIESLADIIAAEFGGGDGGDGDEKGT